jgi:hypothetical protein
VREFTSTLSLSEMFKNSLYAETKSKHLLATGRLKLIHMLSTDSAITSQRSQCRHLFIQLNNCSLLEDSYGDVTRGKIQTFSSHKPCNKCSDHWGFKRVVLSKYKKPETFLTREPSRPVNKVVKLLGMVLFLSYYWYINSLVCARWPVTFTSLNFLNSSQ